MTGWLAILLIGSTTGVTPACTDDVRHVRSGNAAVRALLAAGYDRSPTFKALVDEIDASHAIVYVEPMVMLSDGREGALLHIVAGSRDLPILRVVLKSNLGVEYGMTIVAHELQHVVELLRAGVPVNSTTMHAIFAALDRTHASPGGGRGFETEEARAVARRVREELGRSRRPISKRPPQVYDGARELLWDVSPSGASSRFSLPPCFFRSQRR